MNLKKLAEQRTIQLLKRFGCLTGAELEDISSRGYATNHFDITTVSLIVETLLQDALEAGLSEKVVVGLGLDAIKQYGPQPGILSPRQREVKHWVENRHIHGTPRPAWYKGDL